VTWIASASIRTFFFLRRALAECRFIARRFSRRLLLTISSVCVGSATPEANFTFSFSDSSSSESLEEGASGLEAGFFAGYSFSNIELVDVEPYANTAV
jgi:hypothetical protein